MPYKRSRLDSSGNFSRMESESTTTNFPSAASPPPNDQSAAAAVATAAPTGGAGGSNQVRLGEFLEKCSFCKKSISRNRNIFMYRSCAFCSVECRGRQISIDDRMGRRQNQPAKPNQTTAVIATPPGMNNAAAGGHSGAGF